MLFLSLVQGDNDVWPVLYIFKSHSNFMPYNLKKIEFKMCICFNFHRNVAQCAYLSLRLFSFWQLHLCFLLSKSNQTTFFYSTTFVVVATIIWLIRKITAHAKHTKMNIN